MGRISSVRSSIIHLHMSLRKTIRTILRVTGVKIAAMVLLMILVCWISLQIFVYSCSWILKDHCCSSMGWGEVLTLATLCTLSGNICMSGCLGLNMYLYYIFKDYDIYYKYH